MQNTKRNRGDIRYSRIPNELLYDADLSLKAKGLYAFMFGKPEDFRFTIKGLVKMLKEGESAIQQALVELRSSGWVDYQKNNDGSGVYYFNWSKPELENLDLEAEAISGKPKTGKSSLGKSQRINKTDSNKTEYKQKRMSDIDGSEILDSTDHENFAIALMWWNLFRENRTEAGAPLTDLDKANWKNFVDPIRLMRERDGVTLEQFRTAYDFLKISEFWKGNIFSTSKLRKQIATLITQSKRTNGQQSKGSGSQSDEYKQQLASYTEGVLHDAFGGLSGQNGS